MNILYPTTELAVADISARLSVSQAKSLKDDPATYIATEYGVDGESIDIRVVENSATTMNLPLPYYSSVASGFPASVMDDDAIAEVTGGECGSGMGENRTDAQFRRETIERYGQEYWDKYHAPECDPTPNTTSSNSK